MNYSLRLDPNYGFMWRQEFLDEDSDNDITSAIWGCYEVVNHDE